MIRTEPGGGGGSAAALAMKPSEQSAVVRRAWRRILDAVLGDETQRAAQRHCHESLANVPTRIAAFRAAPEPVQTVTRMILRERVERRASGNAAPAATALVASVATAATLVGALFLALLNGFFGQMGTEFQPSAAQVTSMIQATAGPVGAVALALVVIGLVVGHRARTRDRERAMCAAWLSVYEDSSGGT